MTGTTSGAGTAFPSRAPEFKHLFLWGTCGAQSLFSKSLFDVSIFEPENAFKMNT
jgi:hypothetical protein